MTTKAFTVKLDGYVKTPKSRGTVIGKMKHKDLNTRQTTVLYLVLLEEGKTGLYLKDELSDGYE